MGLCSEWAWHGRKIIGVFLFTCEIKNAFTNNCFTYLNGGLTASDHPGQTCLILKEMKPFTRPVWSTLHLGNPFH